MKTIMDESAKDCRSLADKIYTTFDKGAVRFETLGDFCCAGKVLTDSEANLLKIACYAVASEIRVRREAT